MTIQGQAEHTIGCGVTNLGSIQALSASRDSVNSLACSTPEISKMKNQESVLTIEREMPASLSLVERFGVTGAVWEVSTNCPEILATMREEFHPSNEFGFPPDLRLAFYVDSALPDHGRQVRPFFRAHEHLYYGTYGPGDSMLVDQLNRRAIGAFSLATARDATYWKRVILPCLVGITSASVGVTPVHCACVVRDGKGLLLHGESGSGKSTLSLVLSQDGFSYLSDDCTYVSRSKGGLRCWGLSAPLKLLPEATEFFPWLADLVPNESLNGEFALQVPPTEAYGISRTTTCEPRWLVFIERTGECGSAFRSIGRGEAAQRLACDLEILPTCIADQRDRQLQMIEALVQQECVVLRHGLHPHALAVVLTEFCNR